MKSISVTLMIIIITGILFSAGCTAPQPGQNDSIIEEPARAHSKPVNLSSSDLAPDSERYYYNIRIVPPSVLTTMQKELGPDEYLMHNEKDDLIGIVSPKSLFLRGDLVQLEQNDGARTGKDFDKTDIAEHLTDIAFGFDNAKLVLFKTDRDYKFWFDGYYSKTDLQTAKEFAKFFNSLSDSTQFEDEEITLGFLMKNYAEIPYNFYNIKIIPAKMLDDFKDNRADTDHLLKDSDGTLIGIISTDHLYLLDSLKEEDRQYYIKKGVLYSMGLHGTSFQDRESFFYRESGKNRNLSDLDTEAIRLLYGGRLKTGMDLEETRKTLGLTV
jgi:hypothetical protein